jgi:hypothetical protein
MSLSRGGVTKVLCFTLIALFVDALASPTCVSLAQDVPQPATPASRVKNAPGSANGNSVIATVTAPDGSPAAKAQVAIGNGEAGGVEIANGEIGESDALYETDSAGRFQIVQPTGRYWMVVVHPSGFIRLECGLKSTFKIVRLTPWARVEGTFRVARTPRPGTEISLTGGTLIADSGPDIIVTDRKTTDGLGHFAFDRVIPGERWIGRQAPMVRRDVGTTQLETFCMIALHVDPGKTTHVNLGGSGRPVIGQVRMPAGSSSNAAWNFAIVEVIPEHPPLKKLSPYFLATVDHRGNFCIDDVIPGQYQLNFRFFDEDKDNGYYLKGYRFAVPAVIEKLSQRPVDLGVLTLAPAPRH